MTAQQLQDEYNLKLEALQRECLHLSTMDVLEAFGPGHFTGRNLRMCNICDKVLKITNDTDTGTKKVN